MTGFLFLFAIVVWIILTFLLTWRAALALPKRWWRTSAVVILLAILLVTPVLDEIVGGRQFAALCKVNSSIQINRTKAAGRPVYVAATNFVQIEGAVVPVLTSTIEYVDVDTNETVISYLRFRAHGGWLTRWLSLSESQGPLTFKGWCSPREQSGIDRLLQELRITIIELPKKK